MLTWLCSPQIVVLETLPKQAWSDRLTIMHGALAGILADDPIDDDGLLSLCKPAFLTPEPTRSLAWTGWHETERKNTEEESEKSL
jgi:hypothetical protein